MTITITVPIQGYFHDAAFFSAAEIAAGAGMGACIYLDGTHAYSQAQVDQIRAAGKMILLNHENAALQLEGGAAAGTTAATAACNAAIARGFAPNGTLAIHYSVDGSVAPGSPQFAAVEAAFRNIRAVHAGRFLIGFYGELALYKALKALGLVDVKCWLSGSTSFPGYNPNDPDVGLVQQVGTDIPNTDRDAVIDCANLGVWRMSQPTDASIQQDDVLADNAALLPSIQEDVADDRAEIVTLASIESSIADLKNTIAGDQAALLAAISGVSAEMTPDECDAAAAAIAASLNSTLPPAVVAAIGKALSV